MKQSIWFILLTSGCIALFAGTAAKAGYAKKTTAVALFCFENLELDMDHPKHLSLLNNVEKTGTGMCHTELFNYEQIFKSKPVLAVLNSDKTDGMFAFSLNLQTDNIIRPLVKKFINQGWKEEARSKLAAQHSPEINMAVLSNRYSQIELIGVPDIFDKPMVFARLTQRGQQ